MSGRNFKKLYIGQIILQQLLNIGGECAAGLETTIHGIPPTAKVVASDFDKERLAAVLVLQDDSFEEVPMSHYLPELHICLKASKDTAILNAKALAETLKGYGIGKSEWDSLFG